MRRLLSTVLILYWTAAFAVLAFVCTIGFDDGPVEMLRLLGLTDIATAALAASGPLIPGFFGALFGLAGLVFLWALLTALLDGAQAGELEEVLRIAVAFGGTAFIALLVAASLLSVAGAFTTVAIHLAALLASYLAARTEEQSGPSTVLGPAGASRSPVHSMAVSAAFSCSVQPRRKPSGGAR